MTNRVNISKGFAPIKAVHNNLDQEIIQITEDRLRLLINEHLEKSGKRWEWKTPLCLFLSVIMAMTTASFKDSLALKAPVWEAIFIIVAALSLAWLLKSIIESVKIGTVDQLIDVIKRGASVSS
jgi:hypothetical protein